MPLIKSREVLQTIKAVERTVGQVKKGIGEVKEQANETQNGSAISENEYAGNQAQSTEARVARLSLFSAKKIGQWGLRTTQRNIRHLRHRPVKLKVEVPKTLPTPERHLLSAPKNIKTGAKTVKTSAKVTKRTTKATVKATKRASETAKKIAVTTKKAVVAAVKATVKAVKVTVAAVKGIIAAIAAGGWVVVLIIALICMVGLVIGSVYSIFAPSADGDYSISYMVSKAEGEYQERIDEIIQSSPHDVVEVVGKPSDIREVLAVFAVTVNAEGDELITLNEKKQQKFEVIFWEMNSIQYSTFEREEKLYIPHVDEDGKPYITEEVKTVTVLQIQEEGLSAFAYANQKDFSNKKMEYLTELLSDKNKEMWEGLIR